MVNFDIENIHELEYKSVIVTGVYGFIGSHLIRYLVKKYPLTHFIGIDKKSYCSDSKNIVDIMDYVNFTMKEDDICDKNTIDEIIKEFSVDCIIHLAAYTAVDLSFETPFDFTKNNVLGTHILLELVKENSAIKRFIYMSTDEVYGPTKEFVKENGKFNPTNPYSATKAAAELLCNAYIQSYKLPIIITRANNIYGSRQFKEKAIPKFINQLLDCSPITIHGNGSVLRNFLHVDDFCKGYDYIINYGKTWKIYNIGSDYEISVKELGEKILNLIKNDEDFNRLSGDNQRKFIHNDLIDKIIYVKDRPFNDTFYHINCEKIHELGWYEKISFDSPEGLSSVVNYYINDYFNKKYININKYMATHDFD